MEKSNFTIAENRNLGTVCVPVPVPVPVPSFRAQV